MSESGKFTKDDAYRILDQINSRIGNADTKTSFGLAFIAIVTRFVFEKAGTTPAAIQAFLDAAGSHVLTFGITIKALLVLAMGFSCLESIVMFFISILGRTKNSPGKSSVIFFGSIAGISLDDYKSKAMNMFEADISEDLLEQIHICSKICVKKYKYYNQGLYMLLVTIVLFFICMFFNLI